MLLSGREWQEWYRFAFNGKEQDPEQLGQGNIYDYGFRIYNPRLGKFLSVDPLTMSYPWYTPYQFAGNCPIWCIDLDGMEGRKNTKRGQVAVYHVTYVYDSPGHLSYETAVYNPRSRFHRYTTGTELVKPGRESSGMIVFTTTVFTYQWYSKANIATTTRSFIPYEEPLAITPIKPELLPLSVEPIDLVPISYTAIIPDEPVLKKSTTTPDDEFAGSAPHDPIINVYTNSLNYGLHFNHKKQTPTNQAEEDGLREFAREILAQTKADGVTDYHITLYGNIYANPSVSTSSPCPGCDGGETVGGLMTVRAKYVKRIMKEEGLDPNKIEVKIGSIINSDKGQSVGVDISISKIEE